MLQKVVIPLLLLLSTLSYAQDNMLIDASFEEEDLFEILSFYHDPDSDETTSSITTKEFQSIDHFPTGLKNTKLWFRTQIQNTSSEPQSLFLKFKTNAISRLVLYQKTAHGLLPLYTHDNPLERRLDIPFTIDANTKHAYYLEVSFKQSTYFPSKILSSENNAAINQGILIINVLCYGFSIVALFINLLFFFTTKNRFFLYYSFLFVAIFLSIIDTQGVLSTQVNNPALKYPIIVGLNVLFLSSFFLFTSNALELPKYFPKHKIIGWSLFIGLLLFYGLFFATANFMWYRLAKCMYFAAILFFWFYSILLFRTLIYARFFSIAYFLLLCFEIYYMLSVNLGLFRNFYTDQLLLFGFLIELLVFLYAISYRHKEVEKNHDHLEFSYSESLKNIEKLQATLLKQKAKTEVALEERIITFQEAYGLNTRETEVLRGHLKGHKNKDIANDINLSEASVKHYNRRLFERTDTKNKIQLIQLFNQHH